jgi:hypothetical protein
MGPALLEFGIGLSVPERDGVLCCDIALANTRDLRAGEKRYRYTLLIQFGSSHVELGMIGSHAFRVVLVLESIEVVSIKSNHTHFP